MLIGGYQGLVRIIMTGYQRLLWVSGWCRAQTEGQKIPRKESSVKTDGVLTEDSFLAIFCHQKPAGLLREVYNLFVRVGAGGNIPIAFNKTCSHPERSHEWVGVYQCSPYVHQYTESERMARRKRNRSIKSEIRQKVFCIFA